MSDQQTSNRARLAVQAVGIFRYFTRHKTAANLLLVIMVVMGLAAMPQMRAQFFPDVVVDNIRVDVPWPGAGAEDIDRAVVELVSPALQAVEGVTEVSAESREGRASFTLEFETDWDMARANNDVQDAID